MGKPVKLTCNYLETDPKDGKNIFCVKDTSKLDGTPTEFCEYVFDIKIRLEKQLNKF